MIKQNTIEKMDLVYENAFITLNAIAGPDAGAGFSGVRAHNRGREQVLANVNSNLQLIFPLAHDDLEISPWVPRAWT